MERIETEENIWTEEGGSNRREKTAK